MQAYPQKHFRATAINGKTSREVGCAIAHPIESLPGNLLSSEWGANVSYQHAQEDVELFTGIKVAAKSQQRLVHQQTFDLPDVDVPVEELSVDGGKIRIRTPQGEPCIWKDFALQSVYMIQQKSAFFQDNAAVINWVNNQPLAENVTCLGDGFDIHPAL